MVAIYYFRQLYTTYGGYKLLSTAVYYFRRIYITFDGYILLLALPQCAFVIIQDFFRTYGLKARLDSNSDCNWTRTQNHLVLKRTLNHLAKLAK